MVHNVNIVEKKQGIINTILIY